MLPARRSAAARTSGPGSRRRSTPATSASSTSARSSRAGRFEWARAATWVFWPLYVFLPVNSAVFLWRLRDWRVPGPLVHARAALTILAVVLGGYGVALLVVPETATAFWPWPVDAFHARIYAATYLTPAVGAWVIRDGATPAELGTLGLTLTTFGIAAIVAVPTNTGFFVLNAAPILAGAALLISARPASAPAATPA